MRCTNSSLQEESKWKSVSMVSEKCGENGKSGVCLIIPPLIKMISSTRKMETTKNNSVQVNIREGLVPDGRLWLVQFHHPKPNLDCVEEDGSKDQQNCLEEDLSIKQCLTIMESR